MRCKCRTARNAAGRASWLLLFALAVYGPAFGQSPETTSRVITLSVVNGEIVGRDVVRVTQGDRVDLRWVTDVPLVIHLHGYDVEKSLEPGVDA
ncbi:MAG: hypothetical protein ACC655_08040, partial [Rhodothermia bacterium]